MKKEVGTKGKKTMNAFVCQCSSDNVGDFDNTGKEGGQVPDTDPASASGQNHSKR